MLRRNARSVAAEQNKQDKADILEETALSSDFMG
jgi:hypothetical protein